MSGWKDDDAVTITYRTLRQAQAEAAAAEQERIIKLLEAELNAERAAMGAVLSDEPFIDMTALFEIELKIATWKQAIALIKGKN